MLPFLSIYNLRYSASSYPKFLGHHALLLPSSATVPNFTHLNLSELMGQLLSPAKFFRIKT